MMRIRTLPLLLCPLLISTASAQQTIIDTRDQAQGWYLPVECTVTANGGNTNQVAVTLYKDNEQVVELPPEKKRSSFQLDLDIDSYYTIRVSKEGYREKLVYVDTHLPENQVKYGKYPCYVNLEPMDRFQHSDPFYLDFPSAIVRWNEEKQMFTHSDGYLADIQLKVALLGAQMETR